MALCQYSECEKKDNCFRYNPQANQIQGYEVNFNKVCFAENNYKYYWKKDIEVDKIIKTDKEGEN